MSGQQITQQQIVDALRPHVARIAEAVRAKVVPARTFSADSQDDDEPAGFTAEDAARFTDYYDVGDDGMYPGHIHRTFRCGIKQFAEATGLRRRPVSREGRAGWAWVAKSGTDTPAVEPDAFEDSPVMSDSDITEPDDSALDPNSDLNDTSGASTVDVANSETASPAVEPNAFAAAWDESKHKRDHGRFAKKGSGGAAAVAKEPPPKSEPKKGGSTPPKSEPKKGGSTHITGPDAGPSKPGQRHATGAVKILPWKPPPPPKAKAAGTGAAKRPKGKRSQTKLGDHAEELARQLGYRSILPPGRRSNTNVAKQGSSIDLEDDHSGVACELKMCSVNSTEYKAKPKRSEIDDKIRYAKMHKLRIRTTLCVYDPKNGEAHFYQSKDEGIITRKLSEKAFDFVGTVKFGRKS